MNLTEHVQKQGGAATASCPVIAKIADAAGCSAGTLYMIALGHKRPSWKLAGAIEQATGAAVTRHDLRPDIFDPPAKRRRAA